jgi:hypothetical protein
MPLYSGILFYELIERIEDARIPVNVKLPGEILRHGHKFWEVGGLEDVGVS